MARLTNPETETVIRVEGELEDFYRSQGWVEVLEEKPRRRTRK
jgi:hypothetical protein